MYYSESCSRGKCSSGNKKVILRHSSSVRTWWPPAMMILPTWPFNLYLTDCSCHCFISDGYGKWMACAKHFHDNRLVYNPFSLIPLPLLFWGTWTGGCAWTWLWLMFFGSSSMTEDRLVSIWSISVSQLSGCLNKGILPIYIYSYVTKYISILLND